MMMIDALFHELHNLYLVKIQLNTNHLPVMPVISARFILFPHSYYLFKVLLWYLYYSTEIKNRKPYQIYFYFIKFLEIYICKGAAFPLLQLIRIKILNLGKYYEISE